MRWNKHLLLIILSFIAIYFIWGSTYLFLAFVVEELPPFLLASIRFMVASVLMLGILFITRSYRRPTIEEVKNSVIAGILFLVLGNGGVSWAIQYVDSGYTALIIAAQPLVLVLMMWVMNKKPLPWKSWVGVFIGLLGMYLLIGQNELVHRPGQWVGILVIFFCLIAWGVGSLFVSKAKLPQNFVLNSSLQMAAGGVGLLLLSFLLENWDIDWKSLSPTTIYSLAYLIVFGSVIAFTAFNYLLKHVSPEKVSTSTYINPLVALFLGWYFRDEIVTHQSIVTAIVLLSVVYFMNSNRERERN